MAVAAHRNRSRRQAEASSASLRRTRGLLLAATAVVVLGGAAAGVLVSLHASGPQAAAAAATPAAGTTPVATRAATSADPGDPLVAAANAVGFHSTMGPDVGLVEDRPADTLLPAPDPGLLAVGTMAPEFSLQTPTGERVQLSSLRGRTVLLEFFATWCPHCQAEAAHLQRLLASLPEQKFAFLGVNADSEDAASVYAYDRFFGVSYPTLLDPGGRPGSFNQAGSAGSVTRAYGVAFYPTFYVIDPSGRIVWRANREQPDALILQKLHQASED
jgi:peroxiredoxin